MSTVTDNLATLRAYPLNLPGSTAADNVAKLRQLDPDSLVIQARRIFKNIAPSTPPAGRVTFRSLIGATIGTI